MHQESEGVSTRYLLVGFFAVVLLCAVFFSLGYFLGYKEGHAPGALLTERVGASSDVPSAVNSSGAAPSESASVQPPPLSSQPTGEADSTGPDQNPAVSAGGAAPATTPVTPDGTPAAADSGSANGSDASASRSKALPSGLLIQVAALTTQPDAARMADALHSRGFPALILTPQQARAHDDFFRVVAGPYKTRAAANEALGKLSREGFKPFVRQ